MPLRKPLRIIKAGDDIAAVLRGATIIAHGERTQVMVPDPSNWPTKEDIKRAVQEFNGAHLNEWQKFESLLPDEKTAVIGSRR